MNDLSSHIAETDPSATARKLMQKAHNRDGLPEITAGLFLLWIAALIYAQRILPRGSLAFKLVVAALALLMPLMCFGLPWAVKWLRRRFLLARVGYVKSRPLSRRPVYLGIVIAILALLLFGYAAPHWHWELAAAGIFWGGLTVLIDRSPRFLATAVVAVLAGVWLTLTGVALDLGFAILWGGLGLISLLSGTVVLLRFLRQPAENDESVGEESAGA